jgi:hypothetical protein
VVDLFLPCFLGWPLQNGLLPDVRFSQKRLAENQHLTVHRADKATLIPCPQE